VHYAYFAPHPDPLAKTCCLSDPSPVCLKDYETNEALRRTPNPALKTWENSP
ncbi:hypothetical protein O181_113413, partial [Austropuccinia psidii MF-1]|nr:hypothetical protein [Austropuccinia psidii MF-1]